MTDRDHFAAAALTWLLAGKEHNRDIDGADHAATAYYIADAMLRERERAEVSDRLTDAEREAIERSAVAWETDARMGLSDGGVAVTLRGLLERAR